ncbi:MAG TPA: DUF2490 domain-containing protein [Methylophilus sp.]|nr:DUF2490 domain-containing protein [Methylophilus sp.]
MKNLFLRLLCTFFSILFFSSHASAGPEEDGGYWFNVHMQGDLPVQNFGWSMDTNPRWRNEGKHIDYLYLRPALFYKLSPQTNLWLGHDTIIGHPEGKSAYHETRWYEQFQYQFEPVSSVTFSNRTRLEERSREGFQDTGHRLRQMIKATMPLKMHPQLSLVISNELFINFNPTDWGARRGIDQNRLFIGSNWAFNKSSYLEAGYLNQIVHKATTNLENHVITATLGFKF